MSIIRRSRRQPGWFAFPRETAQDENLSYEATGLLVYLLSKPDDWEAQLTDIERRGKIGEDKRRRLVAELESAGYFERKRTHENGRFDYVITVHEFPLPADQRTSITKESD